LFKKDGDKPDEPEEKPKVNEMRKTAQTPFSRTNPKTTPLAAERPKTAHVENKPTVWKQEFENNGAGAPLSQEDPVDSKAKPTKTFLKSGGGKNAMKAHPPA
jgi:hypothetical protein